MKWMLVLLVIVSRLIIHPFNFTALGAFAVLSNKVYKQPVLVTLLTTWVSDILVYTFIYPEYFTLVGNLWIYLSYVLIAVIPTLNNNYASPIVSSLLFFILSNFGVYASGSYGLTLDGLVICYVAALPFLANTFLGDAFYYLVISKLLNYKHYEVI